MDKINFEEAKSKDVLDEKLKLEQELLDKKEDLVVKVETEAKNRDDLIKFRVKKSQLETQDADLIEEEKNLTKENAELLETNKEADELKQKL